MVSLRVSPGVFTTFDPPAVRRIGMADIRGALADGWDDFLAMPSHLVFIGLIYPLIGVGLAALTFTSNALPLLFPLASGFALIGPFAAIGLYEISRRREQDGEASWNDALEVLRSPATPSIVALGLLLTAVFVCWLLTAQLLYEWTFGPNAPEAYDQFLTQVFSTRQGWALIVAGNIIGFAFAAVVLSISVISFPLLLDRHVGVATAIDTSIRAVQANPGPIAAWGLVVAAALIIGAVPLFCGLAVVMPVLGHATWHLYRRLVANPAEPPAR